MRPAQRALPDHPPAKVPTMSHHPVSFHQALPSRIILLGYFQQTPCRWTLLPPQLTRNAFTHTHPRPLGLARSSCTQSPLAGHGGGFWLRPEQKRHVRHFTISGRDLQGRFLEAEASKEKVSQLHLGKRQPQAPLSEIRRCRNGGPRGGEGASDFFSLLHASTSSEFVLVLLSEGCDALLWSGRDRNKTRWQKKRLAVKNVCLHFSVGTQKD